MTADARPLDLDREEERDTPRLGTGRHRLGPREGIRLQVIIPPESASALLKLRIIKGIKKSDVVTIALDIALALPPEELARRVEERHGPDL